MKNRLFCLLVAMLLAALFAGCDKLPTPTASQPNGGTVYITVNPKIAVAYDANGMVTSVTAITEDAKAIVDAYQDYVGKECTQVVTELVTKIGEAGYLSKDSENVTIHLSFDSDSNVPRDAFV